MAAQIIHLRKGDDERRTVGSHREHVAEQLEADGWKRYEPAEPYDAAKAVKESMKAERAEANSQDKKPSETATEAARRDARNARRRARAREAREAGGNEAAPGDPAASDSGSGASA